MRRGILARQYRYAADAIRNGFVSKVADLNVSSAKGLVFNFQSGKTRRVSVEVLAPWCSQTGTAGDFRVPVGHGVRTSLPHSVWGRSGPPGTCSPRLRLKVTAAVYLFQQSI